MARIFWSINLHRVCLSKIDGVQRNFPNDEVEIIKFAGVGLQPPSQTPQRRVLVFGDKGIQDGCEVASAPAHRRKDR